MSLEGDLRAMLNQVQSSYCATLGELECAKEHARRAIESARGQFNMDPQALLNALEDIVDGSPLTDPQAPRWSDEVEAEIERVKP